MKQTELKYILVKILLQWYSICCVILQYFANRYAESWVSKHHHATAATSVQTGNEKKRKEKKRKHHHHQHSRTTGSTGNSTLNAGILSQRYLSMAYFLLCFSRTSSINTGVSNTRSVGHMWPAKCIFATREYIKKLQKL
jgi:hypothetical protein